MAVYNVPDYVPTESLLAGAKTIPRNPTLPQSPLGAYTDSMYEAQDAALRSAYLRKYADLIRQIGYVDPVTGKIIKGDIESTADFQRAKLQRDMFLAGVDTINQAQQEGNYFSGFQVTRKARAEQPYATDIAGLDVSVARGISDAQEQAAQALEDYIIQRNMALAEAAQRQAQAGRENPTSAAPSGPWTPPTLPPGTTPGSLIPPGFKPPTYPDPIAPRGGPPPQQVPIPPADLLPPGWAPPPGWDPIGAMTPSKSGA